MIDAIAAKAPGFKPKVAVILGSGLGSFADEVKPVAAIPYAELPGFPQTTVGSHAGRLVLGHWPGLTRFLLLHGAAGPAAWQPGEVEEFIAASRQPGTARAGEALHWQFVLHDIPRIIARRNRGLRLRVPTVILAGSQDWMLPPKLLAGAERHAEDLQLRVVPGAGHFLADEHPAVVAEAARELFRRR